MLRWAKHYIDLFNDESIKTERDLIEYLLINFRIGVSGLAKRFNIPETSLSRKIKDYKLEHLRPVGEELKKITKHNREQAMLLKYGVDHMSKIPSVRESKMGDKNPSRDPYVKKKKEETFMKNYGVDNIFRLTPQLKDEWNKNIKKRELEEIEIDKFTIEDPLENIYRPEEYWDGLNPRSSYEVEICDILDNMGIEYKVSDRTLIGPYEIDILIEDIGLAIEFNGIHWHDKDNWMDHLGKDDVTHTECLEQFKTNECKNRNITLHHIWEDDWSEINDKNKYIKNIIEQAKQSQ